jgi:hypothetical protein
VAVQRRVLNADEDCWDQEFQTLCYELMMLAKTLSAHDRDFHRTDEALRAGVVPSMGEWGKGSRRVTFMSEWLKLTAATSTFHGSGGSAAAGGIGASGGGGGGGGGSGSGGSSSDSDKPISAADLAAQLARMDDGGNGTPTPSLAVDPSPRAQATSRGEKSAEMGTSDVRQYHIGQRLYGKGDGKQEGWHIIDIKPQPTKSQPNAGKMVICEKMTAGAGGAGGAAGGGSSGGNGSGGGSGSPVAAAGIGASSLVGVWDALNTFLARTGGLHLLPAASKVGKKRAKKAAQGCCSFKGGGGGKTQAKKAAQGGGGAAGAAARGGGASTAPEAEIDARVLQDYIEACEVHFKKCMYIYAHRFFDQCILSVEIFWQGELSRTYFPRPAIGNALEDEAKVKLRREIDLSTEEDQLKDFVKRARQLKDEMVRRSRWAERARSSLLSPLRRIPHRTLHHVLLLLFCALFFPPTSHKHRPPPPTRPPAAAPPTSTAPPCPRAPNPPPRPPARPPALLRRCTSPTCSSCVCPASPSSPSTTWWASSWTPAASSASPSLSSSTSSH